MEIGKTLIGLGIVLLIIGFCLRMAANLPIGRLPGDFRFQLGNLTLHFPLVTCLLASFVISIGLWVFRHFFGR